MADVRRQRSRARTFVDALLLVAGVLLISATSWWPLGVAALVSACADGLSLVWERRHSGAA